MEYFLKTSLGIFRIKPNNGRWGLFIENELLGGYISAIQAADDVAQHATGYDDWDISDIDAPEDLSEWIKQQ